MMTSQYDNSNETSFFYNDNPLMKFDGDLFEKNSFGICENQMLQSDVQFDLANEENDLEKNSVINALESRLPDDEYDVTEFLLDKKPTLFHDNESASLEYHYEHQSTSASLIDIEHQEKLVENKP